MTEIQQAFHNAHPDLQVQLNLAGSNVLAQQIQAGANADLFLSANSQWMNDLQHGGFIDPQSRRPILSNQLVLIQNPRANFSLTRIEQLPDLAFRYLAIGSPEVVPAGVYAKQFLSSVSRDSGTVWDALEHRIAPAADVRRALAMVVADPSVLGWVYATDLVQQPKMRVMFSVPLDEVAVTYEAAKISTESVGMNAQRFLDFLDQSVATEIFRRHGFGISG